ncbi:centriolin isoform X5 [Anopheles sinensis]|uniref:Centriolin isoform X5 n=1 Tax=Anopheles sinensis TaxID=74873 RepID=A0A084W6Q5_ANOSI|nr:centriolin isoform X5 [Anopheles sinensis]
MQNPCPARNVAEDGGGPSPPPSQSQFTAIRPPLRGEFPATAFAFEGDRTGEAEDNLTTVSRFFTGDSCMRSVVQVRP